MITVCGQGATLEELRAIKPVTPPNAGKRWKAIQHGEFVDTLKDEVVLRGWSITEERYTTAREGADMAGALLLDRVANVPEIPGMSLAIGFLNNNTRHKALRLTVGANVMCCTNGMCTGNILLNRVHDRTVVLEDEIDIALDRYVLAAQQIPSAVQRLREYEFAPGEASEILMEAGRRRLVGWAAIGRVDKEYQNPTFGEHGKGTPWALLNAFTYAARPNIRPTEQMEKFNTFRTLLPGGADLN